MKTLFIKLGALGGVFRATPLFTGLKEKYPASELHVVTRENAKDLLNYNKDIDKLWVWEKERDKIKEISFDWVINTEDDEETCRFASNLKTRKFTGPYYSKTGKIEYTKDVAIWYDMGKISRFGLEKANELKKLNNKGYQEIYCEILELPKKSYPLVLNMIEEEKELSKKFRKENKVSKNDVLIGINTGAGENWPLKALSTDKTVLLMERLAKLGFKVVLLGGPNETKRNNEIIKKTEVPIIDSGTQNSLRKFISIINSVDLIITSDTLALHLAVALKKRVVCFFGPTSAEEIELYGQGVKIKPNSECYCCFKKERTSAKMCIDEIKAEDIIEATLEQIKFLNE